MSLSHTPGRQALPYIAGQLKSCGVHVNNFSRLWLSRAWPDPNDPPYHNAVIEGLTTLPPQDVMTLLHRLEAEAGRIRDGRANAPRTLDLDLIAYGGETIDEPGLVVPHPRAHERAFVMGPLAEIASGWMHPVLKKTAAELYRTATVGRDAHPLVD
jgi:2-amino-4-hydroxy-6-hydroxymethyldihydropteridine diphosphokinase